MKNGCMVLTAILAGSVLLLVGGCGLLYLIGVSTAPLPSPDESVGELNPAKETALSMSTEPTVKAAKVETVTLSNFNRVKTGMTLDDVAAILGTNHETMADSELAGIRTTILTWNSSGFAAIGNCNVTFQNGKVVMKAQAFLK